MKKLAQLRQQLLKLPYLKLKPEEVTVFVEQGKVLSYYARPNDPKSNDHFQIEYTASIIVLNYSGAVEVLLHCVNQWLRQYQPNHRPDAVGIQAEILNHDAVNIRLTVEGLKDTFKPTVNRKGTTIVECTNQHADPILGDGLRAVEAATAHTKERAESHP